MAKTIKLKKGYDIKVLGTPEAKIAATHHPNTYAIKPTDFIGIAPIPKLLVEVGTHVKAGEPIFFNKKTPDVLYVSPVSGILSEIRRGPKRSIAEVVIKADAKVQFKSLGMMRISSASRNDIIKHMLATGCWPFLRQRPFNVIADPTKTPKNIFISCFDTSPLGSDYNFSLKGLVAEFQAGLDVLAKLTDGKVYLGLDGNNTPCDTFEKAKNVEKVSFKGMHPAGCVGVQIHHIAPISVGDIVWTINPNDVVALGRVFNMGKYDTQRVIATGGPCVKNPAYYRTYLGASIDGLFKNNLTQDHVRFISGNILTGSKITKTGFINFYDYSVSVLEEGDEYEMFGWLMPSYARPSVSRTFTSFLTPKKQYNVNTNTHGESRAFAITGVYEKVTPMDILPMQLLKAVLARDFELMEGLGLYEVVEEDLALCEFVCPSKVDVQEILREGMTYVIEQG